MKIVSKFSKSLIISLFVIGISIFTISSCDNISNTGTPDNKENPGNENDTSRYGTPCDKTLGNGNYILHNFIGEETDSINVDNSMAKSLNYYLGKGETYVMDLVDKFSKSLQDRPAAQAYFNSFISGQKSNKFQRLNENGINPYSFDKTVNGIINPCRSIFENMIRNIDNNRDRALFIQCYQTLANESFKYGLGQARNGSNKQMDYYQETREAIEYAWTSKTINNPFDINDDIDNQNCRQVTNEMDKLLTHVANNLNNGVTASDLRQVINIANTADSLTAMHARSNSALEHTTCSINLNIVDQMYDIANEMFWAEQQQAQGLGL